MSKNKKIIVSIVLTLILLLSGTYALFNVLTEQTDVIVTMDGDQISFDAGQNITVDGLVPVYDMENGIVKDIEIFKENGDYVAGINLYLKLKSWPTSFSNNSMRWALYKNGNYLFSGSFIGAVQGDSLKLTGYTQRINLEDNKDSYKLYIWCDALAESGIDMMKQSFTVSLYGEVSFYLEDEIMAKNTIPNIPDLVDGMIPVRYNYIINEWVKADTSNNDNSWYDYENKMWANAVLVDSSHRDSYMNAEVDTAVDEEHILAYYVWIPRYKYVLFNVNSEIMNPIEIQIEFEKTTDPISQGDENGEFLSHPAFWWDNNSDGVRSGDGSEELSGIWVGKFETSGTVAEPIIKPNMVSATNLNVLNLYNMNKKIQSTLFLTQNGVNTSDAHMIKNTDWGAIAYLSHSRYGISSEIALNDNVNYITGRQGNYTYNDYYINNGKITSSKIQGNGVKASTTGNVYGIYDLSGGVWDYTMAVSKTSATNSTPNFQNSGFNSNTMPELKYYNLYEYGSASTDYTKRILGDATGETNGWYEDYKNFIVSSNGWFRRGGRSGTGVSSGGFAFSRDTGVSAEYYGSRSVIVKP